jgi:hypothetical protein
MLLDCQMDLLKSCLLTLQGRIQDFKLGGAHLKKLRRAEGGAKIFGVFRVKNHDFTPKNHIFPILGGARAGCARPCIVHLNIPSGEIKMIEIVHLTCVNVAFPNLGCGNYYHYFIKALQ